jgi:AraC-like DNA-binding protein
MHRLRVDGVPYTLRRLKELPEEISLRPFRMGSYYQAAGPFGALWFQQLALPEAEVWISRFVPARDAYWRFVYRRPFTGVHVVIEGVSAFEINNEFTQTFRRNTCNLVLLPFIEVDSRQQKEISSLHLDILFQQEQVAAHVSRLPALADLFTRLRARGSSLLFHQPHHLSAQGAEAVAAFFQPVDPKWEAEWLSIKCRELLLSVLQSYEHWLVAGSRAQGPITERIEEIREYITTHYGEHCNINQLSKMALVSPTVLKTAFKQQYGMGPFAYLQKVRMEQACKMLEEGKQSIAQIAEECGYQNTGNFIKVFKALYGMTPGRFRKG